MKDLSDSSILIVDDSSVNIDLLIEALGDDYVVRVALDGFEALEMVQKAPPDLILLDIMMPRMDGFAVCRKLKSDPQFKAIPIIFITAMTEIDNETQGLEIGAIDYITKPINTSMVKARIRNHLELKYYRDHLEERVKERTAHLNQALKELSVAKEAAEAANAAKSAFLSSMSHELRTPMHGIITATELALDYEIPDEVKEMLEIAHRSGHALIGLIDKILHFSADDGDMLSNSEEPFLLSDLLKSLPRQYTQKGITKSVLLEFEIKGEAPPDQCIGDFEKIYEILTHLLDNAVKFSEPPYRVVLGVQMENEAGSPFVILSVQDEGIGIAPENQKKIFEPFVQLDATHHRLYDGAGLGLAVCKRLVSSLNGTIRVESKLGEGATFYFKILLHHPAFVTPISLNLLNS